MKQAALVVVMTTAAAWRALAATEAMSPRLSLHGMWQQAVQPSGWRAPYTGQSSEAALLISAGCSCCCSARR